MEEGQVNVVATVTTRSKLNSIFASLHTEAELKGTENETAQDMKEPLVFGLCQGTVTGLMMDECEGMDLMATPAAYGSVAPSSHVTMEDSQER